MSISRNKTDFIPYRAASRRMRQGDKSTMKRWLIPLLLLPLLGCNALVCNQCDVRIQDLGVDANGWHSYRIRQYGEVSRNGQWCMIERGNSDTDTGMSISTSPVFDETGRCYEDATEGEPSIEDMKQ